MRDHASNYPNLVTSLFCLSQLLNVCLLYPLLHPCWLYQPILYLKIGQLFIELPARAATSPATWRNEFLNLRNVICACSSLRLSVLFSFAVLNPRLCHTSYLQFMAIFPHNSRNLGVLWESSGIQCATVVVANVSENFSYYTETVKVWCSRAPTQLL